jgi:hypothetical protein
MKTIIQFFLLSIGLSIFICLGTYTAIDYFKLDLNKTDVVKTICFFCILTCLVFYISYLGLKRGPQQFVIYSYAALAIRFLSGLIYVLYYALTHKNYQITFIFYFMLLFILFIVFEIYNLTTKLRSDSARNEEPNDSYN